MNKTTGLMLIGAVLLAGCTQLMSDPAPEQQIEQAFAQAQDSSFLVDYDLSVSGIDGVGGMVESLELGSYEDSYKFTTSVNMLGSPVNVGIYWSNEVVTVCSENEGLECEARTLDEMNESMDGMTLDDVKSNVTDLLEDDMVTITDEGTQTVADRTCDKFSIRFADDIDEQLEDRANSTVPDEQFSMAEGLLNSDQGQELAESNVTMSLCLDSEKGYPAHISASTEQETEIAGETVNELFTLNASSHSSASMSDVEAPVAATVSASCNPLEAEIFSIRHDGEATLTINENNTETVELTAGETTTVNVSEYEQTESDEYSFLGTENTMTLEADGTEDTASCRSESDTEVPGGLGDSGSEFDMDTALSQ